MHHFEYIGGHIWSLIHRDFHGYETSKLSIELNKGKVPVVVSYDPGLVTKHDLQQMIDLIHETQNNKQEYECSSID